MHVVVARPGRAELQRRLDEGDGHEHAQPDEHRRGGGRGGGHRDVRRITSTRGCPSTHLTRYILHNHKLYKSDCPGRNTR
jgi:hypothetical protein